MVELTVSSQRVAYSLIVCLVLSILVVSLRMLARVKQKSAPTLSDYAILTSLALFIAYAGVMFDMAYNPLGTVDLFKLTPLVFEKYLPESFALQILLTAIITFSKLSLLLFLRSIFVTRSFQRINLAVIGLVIAWFFAMFFTLIFQCDPPSKAWNFFAFIGPGTCINFAHIITGYEVTNIFIDAVIVALPMNEIRKLRMTLSKKIGVSIVFILGGLVVVTSAVRIHYVNSNLITVGTLHYIDVSRTFLWTNIQIGATIICACLPTLPPLIPISASELFSRTASALTSLISKPRSSVKSSKMSEHSERSDEELRPASDWRKRDDDYVQVQKMSTDQRSAQAEADLERGR